LNRSAAEAAAAVGARAATDVTGFGLLGHLRNLTAASGCAAVVDAATVPIVPHARAYVEAGIAPGGTHANRRFVASSVTYAEHIDEATQLLLCDAQTSGGLLVAVPAAEAGPLTAELDARGAPCAAVIGHLVDGPRGTIRVA
jgi:selenide,water dikinase